MNSKKLQFTAAENLYPKVTDGTHDSPKSVSFGKCLITSKHIQGRHINFKKAYHISVEDFKAINKRSQVYQWDVIISMIGEYCGYCYIERDKDIDYAIKNVGVFRAETQMDAEWLYYYLTSPLGKSHLYKTRGGSSQPYLSLGGLRTLPVLVPSSQIVKKQIVTLLSNLDEKIDLNNRINAELEGMVKLLYDYWFVQFDFPMTAEQAAAHGDPTLTGKPYKSSGGKMTHNKTLNREIPKGWEAGTIESLGQVVGGSTPSTKSADNFSQGGAPWITPKDLSNNNSQRFIHRGAISVSNQGLKAASLTLHPKGTVLMSSRAPVGYLSIAANPVTTNQGFKSIIPKNPDSSDYVFETLKTYMPVIKANASGSTFKEISGATLKLVKIPVPALELINNFSKTASASTLLILNNQKQNQELAALRDWLLPMLMNGQVTVNSEK